MKSNYFNRLLEDFGLKQPEMKKKTQTDLDNEWFEAWLDEGDNYSYYRKMIMNCINSGRHECNGASAFIKAEIISNKNLFDRA